MQSLQFHPILKRLPWGGRRLGTLLGKSIGEHADYAESWEIADFPDAQSTVVDGPYQGWSLERLIAEEGESLLGRHRRQRFPLLIKFIDARERLSIQVHPNDVQANQLGRTEGGKTEAWVILDAPHGSWIYAGVNRGVDRSAFVRHLERGTIEQCLHRVSVKRGDCIFVPAGTVHAIGEGILLIEIQQPSNVTFRIFDWDRRGSDGKPRPLHREEALTCIDFAACPVDCIVPHLLDSPPNRLEALVSCEHFVVRRHALSVSRHFPAENRFRVLMPLEGTIVASIDGRTRRLGVGETLLVPAAGDSVVVSPVDSASFLEVFLP